MKSNERNDKMIDKKDVTILVNSCDKYEDAWEPFFKLFSIQWPNCPYRIVLNTESKTFKCDYLSVETVHTGECATWTERVKMALKQIDTEFVLFFLEDFFLLSPINQDAWKDALNKMKNHSQVGFLWFPANGIFQPQNYNKEIEPYFLQTCKNTCNRVNALIGLWRKEFLLQMLFRDGDAWYFEWSAVKLSRYSRFVVSFWDQKHTPIFNYEVNPESDYGIVRGKWLSKNKGLFEKHDISVNYDNLGFINETVSYESLGLVKAESKNKYIKKLKRLFKKTKRKLNDAKRFIKLYPAFKKYCKLVHKEILNEAA